MKNSIIVIAEHANGRVSPVTFELIAFAELLQAAGSVSLPIRVLILGANIRGMAEQIADESGLPVDGIDIAGRPEYNGELYRRVLAQRLLETSFSYVCIAQTSQGMDYAPALAVKLNCACIGGVEDILPAANGVSFARPLYGGKIIARVRPRSTKAILTIQPGLFKPNQHRPKNSNGRVGVQPIAIKPRWWHSLGVVQSGSDNTGLMAAEVVVAVGQGFGNQDNLDLARQLASIFSKSTVAGSRVVCDLGWLAYGCQVGVSGAVVSPRLYIACGISGAIQHVAGMRGAEFVVAINKDPAAAIFHIADVCLVADLLTFIPTLIEIYQQISDHQQSKG